MYVTWHFSFSSSWHCCWADLKLSSSLNICCKILTDSFVVFDIFSAKKRLAVYRFQCSVLTWSKNYKRVCKRVMSHMCRSCVKDYVHAQWIMSTRMILQCVIMSRVCRSCVKDVRSRSVNHVYTDDSAVCDNESCVCVSVMCEGCTFTLSESRLHRRFCSARRPAQSSSFCQLCYCLWRWQHSRMFALIIFNKKRWQRCSLFQAVLTVLHQQWCLSQLYQLYVAASLMISVGHQSQHQLITYSLFWFAWHNLAICRHTSRTYWRPFPTCQHNTHCVSLNSDCHTADWLTEQQ